MLVSTILIITANVILPAELSSFKFTHFLFNYESEFVKRGLIGESFRLLGIEMTYQIASITSYIAFVLFSVVFMYVIVRPFKDMPSSTGMWLFIFLATLHSSSIQHFYLDIGRFDTFTFLLAMLGIHIISRYSTTICLASVPLILVLMVLIHEGTFFIYFPLIIGFWIYRAESKKTLLAILSVLLVMVIATYEISTNGVMTKMSADEQYSSLAQVHGKDMVGMHSISVLHVKDLKENLVHTFHRGFNKKRMYEHTKLFIILFPFFLLMMVLLVEELKHTGLSKKLIFVASAFGPLGLYPLGHDHFRWWALTVTNLFIVLSVISYYDLAFKKRLIHVMYTQQHLVMIVIASSVVVGGMGVTSAFQRF